MLYAGLIEKYRQYLPVSDATPVVTLNEGNTPLGFLQIFKLQDRERL